MACGLCKCGAALDSTGRYCRNCRAAYMRTWRTAQPLSQFTATIVSESPTVKIEIALQKKQSMFDREVTRTENTFYGGAKGGGKSHGLREIMLKRRLEYANSRGVIFRKTWPEILDNHIDPLLKKFPVLQKYYTAARKEIALPNGSVLLFRHCDHARDLKKFQGQEYHDLGIEEAGEWAEDWFWTLKGSNRSSNPAIKPRCLMTGNPGGEGHKWLKRLFIERNFRPLENPADFAFISAKVYDNPALMKADPGYVDRLRANKNEALVKAYLEGSWDILAGQFFDVLSRDTHMIEPFEIPEHWRRFGMFDTGYNHPAAFIWMATDEDGNCYIYRELAIANLRTEEFAQRVMQYEDSALIRSAPAGHDCWTKHGGGPSVEEKFGAATNYKLVLHKASIDRIAGAGHIRDYLAIRENGKPRLFIFKNCPMTYDALARMTHDDRNPEDVLKVDAVDGDPWTGDDLYDCLRYGLMDRPRTSLAPPKPKRRRYYEDDGYDRAGESWRTV